MALKTLLKQKNINVQPNSMFLLLFTFYHLLMQWFIALFKIWHISALKGPEQHIIHPPQVYFYPTNSLQRKKKYIVLPEIDTTKQALDNDAEALINLQLIAPRNSHYLYKKKKREARSNSEQLRRVTSSSFATGPLCWSLGPAPTRASHFLPGVHI